MKLAILFLLIPVASAYGQTPKAEKELAPQQLLELLPRDLAGFKLEKDPRSTHMSIGTLTYSMCEKNFTDGKRSIRILLFDFKNAPIMYTQSMRKWEKTSVIESDSIVLRRIAIMDCEGWESYNKHYRLSQIFLGISDRFFLDITGEESELDLLKEILRQIPVAEFPK